MEGQTTQGEVRDESHDQESLPVEHLLLGFLRALVAEQLQKDKP